MKARLLAAGLILAGCAGGGEGGDGGGDAAAGDAAIDGEADAVAGSPGARDTGSDTGSARPDAGGAGDAPAACVRRQCGIHLACGSSTDGCGGTLACPPCAALSHLRVPLQQLAHDPGRQLLYATVPGGSPVFPNRLLTIDPRRLEVIAELPIGSDPTALGLAQDGSGLWVGLDGARALRRVDLTTTPPAVGPMWPVTAPIGSLVGLAGAPRAVAVAFTTTFSQAVILDDGVARPMPSDRQAGEIALLIPGPADLLFGYNDRSTAHEFSVLTVSAAGLTTRSFRGLIDGRASLAYEEGRVYASGGEVLDVSNPAQPVMAGRFPFFGPVRPRGNRRLLMLSQPSFGQNPQPTLRQLEADTFTQLAATPVPVAERRVSDLWLVQPDTVAFIGGDDIDRLSRSLYFFKDASLAR